MFGAEPAPWLSPLLSVCAPMVAPCVMVWRRRIAAAQAGGALAACAGAALSVGPSRPDAKFARTRSAMLRTGEAAPLAAVRATFASPPPMAFAPLFPAAPAA